jgi:hypothetical protein
MKMKKVACFFIVCMLLVCNVSVFAQAKDSVLKKPDTSLKIRKKPVQNVTDSNQRKRKKNTLAINRLKKIDQRTDSLQKVIQLQRTSISNQDTTQKDSLKLTTQDSLLLSPAIVVNSSANIIDKLLSRNKWINTHDSAVYYLEEERTPMGKEFLFYSLCVVVLILGIFKTFFSGYFNNLFRVFFNTSLRQTQLTDQLLQAKLPSLILNIFFTVTTGIYIWLLFIHYNPPRLISGRLLLPFCIVSVAVVYFIKYCLLKFMGWVSDIQQSTDNYIFVIFLVNKITGILLVPFIIVLAFSPAHWISSITTISILFLGLFFLSRYVKSYGVIEKKMPLNPFHFIIYILGAEIIPLLILYKVAVDYLV